MIATCRRRRRAEEMSARHASGRRRMRAWNPEEMSAGHGGECVRGLPRQKNKKPKSSDNETLKAGPGLNINRSIGGGKSGGGGGSKGKGG